MKGSIACLLKALEILDKKGPQPKYAINVSLTCDEEYGEYTGLRAAIELSRAHGYDESLSVQSLRSLTMIMLHFTGS